MNILVRMTNWVGDCLIATPALRAIQQRSPQARVSVLVKASLAPLFQSNIYVHEVIPYHVRRGIAGLWDRKRCAQQLRARQFDLVYIFPRSWDSAFVAYLARIPQRVGYGNSGRRILLTHALKRTRALQALHQSQYYWNLVMGTPEMPAEEKRSDLFLTPQVKQWAQDYFRTHFAQKKVVGLAPGATYGSAKMWLPDRYVALAQQLLKQAGVAVIFFGTAAEKEWLQERGVKENGIHVLAGQTSLMECAALMKQCAVVITNDSGPMHVASAVGAPLIALFGSTRYENTHPLGPHTLMHKHVSCSPCLLRHCPIDHRCMTRITVAEVLQEVNKKLNL